MVKLLNFRELFFQNSCIIIEYISLVILLLCSIDKFEFTNVVL